MIEYFLKHMKLHHDHTRAGTEQGVAIEISFNRTALKIK